MKQLDVSEKLGKEQAENLELIMEVPLQVTRRRPHKEFFYPL